MEDLRISGVCERDVDLLLLEEFLVSPAFVEWFLGRIGVQGSVTLVDVKKSVSSDQGESDLALEALVGETRLMVLIEDKVDAPLQPDQAARYQVRAGLYKAKGRGFTAKTVLVAPEIYLKDAPSNAGFDARVNLEFVLQWFEDAARLEPRVRYKCALLRGAIDRGHGGWQRKGDEAATKFWDEYSQLATSMAPKLGMSLPDHEIPAGSHIIEFSPSGLPKGVQLFHKLGPGHVDLQFNGLREDLNLLRERFAGRLEEGMSIRAAGQSAVVRIRVHRINTGAPFEESRSAAERGLDAAVRLLEWYLKLPGADRPRPKERDTHG